MKYMVIIKGDMNDADYVEQASYIEENEIEQLKRIISVLQTVPKYEHNWPRGEYLDKTPEDIYGDQLTEDDYGFMEEFVPYGEGGIHSIDSIRLLKVVEETKLL